MIKVPADLKDLTYEQLDILSNEIRQELIYDVSNTGGHLASNLGIVELTLALHRVFDCPKDQFVFDVGHQTYVHKILTGRRNQMLTLRKKDGLSGFMFRAESIYDSFGGGHSGTALSAAIGMAIANKLDGKNNYVVAVIGDGSFTNGMVYEALNQVADNKRLNLMIVLNDNEMSISKNVGGLSQHFASMRTTQGYFSFKQKIYNFLTNIPVVGNGIYRFAKWIKDVNKSVLLQRSVFEDLGIEYLGPIDGSDIRRMETVFKEVRRIGDVTVVHVCTKKGSGYPYAEMYPDLYHSVPGFSSDEGYQADKHECFSSVFGQAICNLAKNNLQVCAVTAAMTTGTGLEQFAIEYPDRFFDVGIAEEHAVTFCAGLSVNGKVPIFAVYSSFLQRAYDQLIHDVAIQRLPCIFCVDHAGFVSGDGVTHQGIFDVAFLNHIPGITVYSVDKFDELSTILYKYIKTPAPVVIRYPKGVESTYDKSLFQDFGSFHVADFGDISMETTCVFLTYGRVTENVIAAATAMQKKHIRVIKLLCIKPISYEKLFEVIGNPLIILIVEEGMRTGGVGESILDYMCVHHLAMHSRVILRAIDDTFVYNGTVEELYDQVGMSVEQLSSDLEKLISDKA